jgi:sulfur-carrier protein
MSKVRIPPVLRAQAENNKQVEVEGDTVGAVMTALVERYGGLREQLMSPDGQLNRFVNVYLNDQDIRYLQELQTPVRDADTIVILPAMAGGGWPAGGAGATGGA